MEWAQFLGFLLTMSALFLWNRSESNADRREANADRKEMMNLIKEIKDEMKDFHGRLCAIEERNKK